MVCVLLLSFHQYFYSVQKLLRHIRGQERKVASKVMKVYLSVLQMHQNNSYRKSHRTFKPAFVRRKPQIQTRCNEVLTDGEGGNMETERIYLSSQSCCGSASNDLNIYLLYSG